MFLHIGPPKTGTTYLQSVLWANKRRLGKTGVLVPGRGEAPHFAAAGDLRGRHRRKNRQRKGRGRHDGAWDKLAAEVREWPGTSVISCEWLAFCDTEQVDRALGSFGDAEVHVVVTLRDLGRVVPAVWQEQIKNGKVFTLTEFLTKLERDDDEDYGQLFWSVHDTRRLLDRWARNLPNDRLHVVTLPRSGAHPDELWRRFSSLFVTDPDRYDTKQVRANPGLDPAEAELLRRVNDELDGRMRKGAHGPLVKQFLHEELTRQEGSGGKIRLPADALEPVAARAKEVVAAVEAGGYPVIGSLDELVVDPAGTGTSRPENAADTEVARAAVKSMAALLLTMQADGAHRRKPWRHTQGGSKTKTPGKSAGTGAGDAPGPQSAGRQAAGRAVGLARRAAGRVRRMTAGG